MPKGRKLIDVALTVSPIKNSLGRHVGLLHRARHQRAKTGRDEVPRAPRSGAGCRGGGEWRGRSSWSIPRWKSCSDIREKSCWGRD